jgi:subtilisin family serine protease
VTNPYTQSSLFGAKLASGPLVFATIILALLSTAILFTPRSAATRGVPVSTNPQNQAAASEKRRRPEFVPGEALVRFKKNRAFEGVQHLAVPNNEASVQAFQKSGSQGVAASTEQVLVNVERFEGSDLVDGLRIARMAPNDTLKAMAAFQAREDVIYAEPNYVLRTEATPNDPRFLSNELYGLTKIGAPQAWDITTGSNSVVVGVIDEGIDISHPDLLANIWTNPSPGSIAGITGDLHGYDFRDNTGTITPEGHATHVAGTIGAVGNNNQGVVGVNWQVSLMSLRFISEATNSGTDADAISAYNYAKQMRDLWVSSSGTKGANVRALNASYGGGGYSQAAADALNAVGQSGILFVAAAGNDGADNDVHPHYPSNYSLSNVISVAATNSTDTLAGFSNFGAHSVMLGAPGVGILSTFPSNNYGFLSGTSMATPHVTGAAALLCAANPNLSVNQLRALLSFNGDPIPALQGKSLTERRLNVFKSLQAVNEGDTTPPGTVGGFQITSQNGRRVNLSWTASGDDGPSGQASLYDISFVDQTTNAVVPLTTLAPAISGTTQSISVNLPYRHLSGTMRLREFDNVGNEGTPASVQVNVQPNFADPYTTTLNSAAPLSTGGTPLGLTFDDRYQENYSLPFAFSFFGQLYSTVTISTNGNLYFSTPPKRSNGDADDVPSSISDLSQFKVIAGMWDDLDLRTSRRADADVYVVQPGAGRIIFRWQGVQFGDGTNGDPINFEIELRNDGTVITRYGAGNINLLPVVGISGGEPDAYVIDALTSELSPKSLTNAQSAVFTPRAAVQFSAVNYNIGEGGGSVTITVHRTGDTSGASSVDFQTSDGSATQGQDYVATSGTLSFGTGEISKTFNVLIVEDAIVEPNETLNLTLGNATGTPLAAPSTATITITDNDISKSRKTGVFRPSTGELFLKNANSSGFADTLIVFGNPGDYPLAGDWNGDGVDSVGIYRDGVFYLRNTNSTGFADIVVPFGSPGDQPIAGDWNGDGVDTIGVYRNGTFYLRNSNTAGPPDLVFTLGDPGDVGIAGDWNGDGITTCGVFRPSNGIVYLKNSNTTGFADLSFVFGNAGDKPVAGDWNGDGIDTVGIYRNGLFYLTNSNATGFADIVFALGNSGDFPIAGNWDGSP